MPIVAVLGSFPNSQIRPRNASQNEDTSNIFIANTTVQVIAPANLNRTSLTILNEGPGDLRWRTADEGAPTATDGFLLKKGASIQVESLEEVQAYAIGDCNVSIQEGEG